MIYTEFITLLKSKTNSRDMQERIFGFEDMAERIFTASKFISSTKCTVPLRLVVSDTTGQSINRKVAMQYEWNSETAEYEELGTYLRFPKVISSIEAEIDMDDSLLDALALYVMAGIEQSKANIHMGMFWEQIIMNNDRLNEADLANEPYCIRNIGC